ncbi:MAG: DegV family EDD domain-containing protein [Anaerolineales bacterium]|nr:DegV family EDD domain-containing protein [Anaerolineales bacterium]
MARIHIITDSSARFTIPGLPERHQITLAPMKVNCGAHTIEDWPDTDMSGLRPVLDECQSIPRVEPFSVDQMAALYTQVQSETDQILSIHTSSGLCDAVANAHTASQRFLGRTNIQVIDSQTSTIGLGLLVQAAAEAVARGDDFEALIRLIRGMIPRLYMVFFLDDLFFLEQNGLISRSQAILGNMLGIIPFLTLEEGRMIPMEKVRTRSRAIEKLIEFVLEFSSVEHLAILQDSARPTHESLSISERLKTIHPDVPITTTSYGPCLSSFLGLDSLGVAVLEAEEDSL